MNSYRNFSRRYRPKTFKEVIGQEVVVQTLKNALIKNRVAPAYLFCGGRGTGKTTLARLFAKALNCLQKKEEKEPCNQCQNCLEISSNSSLDVIEIDGASNRGIDDIRRINENAIYSPSSFYKIYIIDEVHMLTKEAFNALLKTLEEPPEKVKFFFATTEPHKMLPTILSRCQRFDLQRIPPKKIEEKLLFITQELQREAYPEALQKIASQAEGSLRDAESLLDQVFCYEEGLITEETVEKALGIIPSLLLFELDEATSRKDLSFAFSFMDTLYQSGKDFLSLIEGLCKHFRTLLYLSHQKSIPESYRKSLSIYTKEELLFLLELILKARHKIQKMGLDKTEMEFLLLQILQVKNRLPLDTIAKKLLELEKRVSQNPLLIQETAEPIYTSTEKPPEKEPLKEVEPTQEMIEPEEEKIPFLKRVKFSLEEAPLQPKKEEDPIYKVRTETLLQFASVELDGSLTKFF